MTHVNALNWLTQTRQQAVRSISDLQGLTACSQQVTLANGEQFVLRSQTQRATDFGVNYQQEALLLCHLSPLGFSPKPIYCDENASLLAWIDGDVPTTFRPDLLRKLARVMSQLHQFAISSENLPLCLDGGQHGVPISFPQLDLAERCQFLWNKLSPEKQQALPFSPPFQPITPFRQALCHHDVHLGNLIEQGERLFLIDWEYAALSDPALDLALFLQANPLTHAEQQQFLKHYFAISPFFSPPCLTKMAQYQKAIAKLNRLWYAVSLSN